tara:strand:- start:136 stop:792 length:657 start_codon:yes stop_codon:yes gene_type:complete
MSYLININDFKGRYRIAVSSFNTLKFQEYIDQVEQQIIVEDFGIDFYDDIEDNVSKDKYQDLIKSGYKDYLLGSVYFYYQRDAFLSTSTGNVKINNSNSVNVPDAMNGAIAKDRYNLGVNYYNKGALDFLNDNAVKSLLIKTANDLSGGLMFLEVAEIEYLYVNDIISINRVDYVVQNVDNINDSITILATGIKAGQKVIYLPFESTYFDKKHIITPF